MNEFDSKNDLAREDLDKRDELKKEEKPSAMKRDLEQTKHDLSGGKKGQELNQDVGDTVKQGLGKEPTPPLSVPNFDKKK